MDEKEAIRKIEIGTAKATIENAERQLREIEVQIGYLERRRETQQSILAQGRKILQQLEETHE